MGERMTRAADDQHHRPSLSRLAEMDERVRRPAAQAMRRQAPVQVVATRTSLKCGGEKACSRSELDAALRYDLFWAELGGQLDRAIGSAQSHASDDEPSDGDCGQGKCDVLQDTFS